MTESGFTIDVDQNQYLPEGGREVSAVVTVTSAADATGLAGPIQDGLEARKQGDEETATAKLGRAVALAHQSGNEETAKLLAKVVNVVDAETGKVRLRKQIEDADEMALDTRSTKAVRARK
jgi:von Willebrand factor type A C-terminal domain